MIGQCRTRHQCTRTKRQRDYRLFQHGVLLLDEVKMTRTGPRRETNVSAGRSYVSPTEKFQSGNQETQGTSVFVNVGKRTPLPLLNSQAGEDHPFGRSSFRARAAAPSTRDRPQVSHVVSREREVPTHTKGRRGRRFPGVRETPSASARHEIRREGFPAPPDRRRR